MKVKSKQMNRCFTSFVIREMHIKTITRCHYTPVRAEIQITDNTRFGDDVEQHEHRCWWEYKKVQADTLGNRFVVSPKSKHPFTTR